MMATIFSVYSVAGLCAKCVRCNMEISDKLSKIKVTNDLFKDVRFYISGNVDSKVSF